MKVYQCDFCNEVKACSGMVVDSERFDICIDCKAELGAKLKGKGRTVAQTQTVARFGRRWNDYFGLYYVTYSIPAVNPAPTYPPPVIVYSGVSSGNSGIDTFALNGEVGN